MKIISHDFFMFVISCWYKETLRISAFGCHGILKLNSVKNNCSK